MKDFNELNEMDEMNENENNKKAEKKNQKKKMMKKGLSISLCAVLAGGLAAGSYHGFNYLNNWNTASNVQAAESGDTLTLLKAKKSNSDDSDKKDTASAGSVDVSAIVEQAMPSVVSISTKSVQEVQDYYGIFSQYGYAPQEREVEGSGSGIIIGKNDTELLIATNYHVVEGADTLSVGFVDNNAYEAKVKGYDKANDLAVVLPYHWMIFPMIPWMQSLLQPSEAPMI